MNQVLRYRPDIDGLRAVAVLPVVLFHLDVALFSGGFVGVDVFFVISGFLITRIIYREVQAGIFSYGRFYERRVRRLFPALAAMLAVSSIAAWFMLMPIDYKNFVDSLVAALIFLANVQFWKETDYFHDSVETFPLLHTWSLAVEEQYYILFPPLLILLVRYVPRHLNWILLSLGLASLWGAQASLSSRPESAFYLVHLRAWELLVGSLLAAGMIPSIRSRALAEVTGLFGLGAIAVSFVLLDKGDSFPGVAALPVVLGTALVIHAGSEQSTLVGRLLSLRFLVFLGLLSYSFYLWHWPIFVFVRYYLIEPFTPAQQIVLFVFALGVAWVSWRFVEAPFRAPNRLAQTRPILFRKTIIAALVLVALALPGLVTRGAAFRLDEPVATIAAVSKEVIPFRRPCFGLSPEQVKQRGGICTLGANGEPGFLLWGDSHALSMAHGVDMAATDLGLSGRFLARSLCPPALNTREFRASEISCSDFNDAVAHYITEHPSLNRVLLVGIWSHYLNPDHIQDDLGFAAGIRRTLTMLAQQGIDVTVVAQVPLNEVDVPSMLSRSIHFERPVDIGPTLLEHHQQTQRAEQFFRELGEEYDFEMVDPASVFCDEQECAVKSEGRPLYRDTDHLSSWGSANMEELMKKALRPASN